MIERLAVLIAAVAVIGYLALCYYVRPPRATRAR